MTWGFHFLVSPPPTQVHRDLCSVTPHRPSLGAKGAVSLARDRETQPSHQCQ